MEGHVRRGSAQEKLRAWLCSLRVDLGVELVYDHAIRFQ